MLARLKPLLEDASVLKIAQNMKFDWLIFKQRGIAVRPVDDIMLLSYVLDAGRTDHGMDVLSEQHLGHKPIQFGEVAGSGRTFIGFSRVAIDKATEYSAEDADVTLRLWRVLKPRLPAEHMTNVYETLERPMIEVLARMEQRGITIDRAILSKLSGEFAQDMARLETTIHELAGETFNPGSPKQLGDILFGKMGLSGARKTATGAWSTAVGVLDDLAEQGNELAARILDWRQLAKLKSTYTDALPSFVDPATGRVHTSYALAATTTGRLSSSDPNLQNIPMRNEAGRKIRRAFIAREGHKLVSADYSQIELRLLAHIAGIPQLKAAFAEGQDIHAMTASEMFGVPVARHAAGSAPPRQGDQLWDHLRHFGLWPRQSIGHPARGGRRLHQKIFRAVSGHSRLYGPNEILRAREWVCDDDFRPQMPLSARNRVKSFGARF